MQTVGVIGVGAMGQGMARRLLSGGFSVWVFDLDPARLTALADEGAQVADSAKALLDQAEVVLLSLPDGAAVAATAEMAPNRTPDRQAVIVDTSTISPAQSRAAAAKFAEKGYGYFDAPVSGGAVGAAAGTLTMLIGGDAEDIARAQPVLEAVSAMRIPVGGVGTGSAAKLINNLLLASNLVTVGEAIGLAETAGVAPDVLVEALNRCSGRSAVTEVNAPRWALSHALNSGFTMALMRKDLSLAKAMLEDRGGEAPILARVLEDWDVCGGRLPQDGDFNLMLLRSAGEVL